MVSTCIYFQVHQPWRLRHYQVFDIGKQTNYFNDKKNMEIIEKIAKKCYLVANNLMLHMINETDGKFKVAYSITGTALDQFERYVPDVIDSFKDLAATGNVEFLSETYYHSLSYLYSKDEFKEQVEMHKKKIKSLFGQTPRIFRNTELIYNNELANFVEKMGYDGILAEGADHLLGWRSPNFVYKPTTCQRIKLLMKNYKLSDDVAFRFSNSTWKEWPLTAEKYANWVNAINGNGEVLNLFMDYETIGEHQWKDTGIFNFLQKVPHLLLENPDNNFMTPSQVIDTYDVRGEMDVHNMVSWADLERDLSAWLGNSMQQSSIKELYQLEKEIKATGDLDLLNDWRKLQTSDHFYYMCTKYFSDGDVHKYFNPYDSPYDSFITFMNVLNDLIVRVKTHNLTKKENELKKEILN